MDKFECVVEDTEVFSFIIEATNEDEAHDKCMRILEKHGFDYQSVMEKHNGNQHDGSLEITTLRLKTDPSTKFTRHMYGDDLVD